jgi:hypothetical protein
MRLLFLWVLIFCGLVGKRRRFGATCSALESTKTIGLSVLQSCDTKRKHFSLVHQCINSAVRAHSSAMQYCGSIQLHTHDAYWTIKPCLLWDGNPRWACSKWNGTFIRSSASSAGFMIRYASVICRIHLLLCLPISLRPSGLHGNKLLCILSLFIINKCLYCLFLLVSNIYHSLI